MILDYHLHTKASPDAKGSMQEYVKKAIEKNIAEIGFSDHIILKHLNDRSYSLVGSMTAYVEDFLSFKEESKLPIKLGVEIDFFPDKIEKIRHFIREYPFDYVIGSVHVIGEWIIDEPSTVDEYSRRDPLEVYEDYFRLVRQMCTCGLFDVLGHPDLVKIFGVRPDKDICQIYKATAEAISRSGMCAEINSKGLIRPCREIYPSLQFLKILHDSDVPITLGSDAHEPCEVGLNLEEAAGLARKVGYTEISAFRCREKTFIRI